MRLAELVDTSERVTATSARLEKTALLADLLRRLEPREVPIAVAYLSGRLRQGRIGLGWSSIRSATDETKRLDEPPSLFDDAPGVPSEPLGLIDVDRAFDVIAVRSGSGSARGRTRALRALLGRASETERQFLVRLVLGELRQGALAGTMEDALARAGDIPLPEIRRAIMLSGSLEEVAVAVLTEGRGALERFRLVTFQPVEPMLAQPAADLDDALRRLGTAALEHKLDGARVQVHRRDREVRVYSRQLNDVTAAVPEVFEVVRDLPLREAVLDGEVVALDSTGRPQPFQITMRRFGRTLDVARMRAELPLALVLFDALRLDDADLLDAPQRERFAALAAHAPKLVVPHLVTADREEAIAFYEGALAAGHEGVMAKSLDTPYEAGGRGYAWLKVKPAHTLDLVVLAAEWGNGRREGWLSNIHLGARDPATGEFVMLGKTFKGMTDEILEWQTRTFPEYATRTEGHVVHLRPEIVVEVAFNDVQESPRYPGGMALRLARVKHYRPDKGPLDADTVDTVRAIMTGERKRGGR
jgi:DNA ligase-1